jgi:NAD(P)-dependent dehydrogenase (short-subunit alcohol dehydrogenase family)
LAKEAGNIESNGGRAIHVAADVGSKEELQVVADRTIEAFGGFDTWVNVAGVTIYGNLWDVEENDSQRTDADQLLGHRTWLSDRSGAPSAKRWSTH